MFGLSEGACFLVCVNGLSVVAYLLNVLLYSDKDMVMETAAVSNIESNIIILVKTSFYQPFCTTVLFSMTLQHKFPLSKSCS
jgi:hypothetical protein